MKFMRNQTIISIVIILAIIYSCGTPVTDHEKAIKYSPPVVSKHAVLDSILSRKVLRAATDYGSLSYLIYRGEPIGYQYELLKEFTNQLGVDLHLVIESNMQRSIEMLDSNKIDLLAMGLTVTSERSQELGFTLPIMTTRQVLVQRKPDGYYNMKTADEIESYMLRNPLDLASVDIYVQEGTIFEERLATLSNEIADTITVIPDARDVEDLIHAVSKGEIDIRFQMNILPLSIEDIIQILM